MNSQDRPSSVAAVRAVLYAIAVSMTLFMIGVGYDLAEYGTWASRVAAPAAVSRAVADKGHTDIGALVLAGIFTAFVLRAAALAGRRRRFGQILALFLMFMVAFSIIGGVLSSADDPTPALDQAIQAAAPALATWGTTWALLITAPLALAGLTVMSLRSARRWFGPPVTTLIRNIEAAEARKAKIFQPEHEVVVVRADRPSPHTAEQARR